MDYVRKPGKASRVRLRRIKGRTGKFALDFEKVFRNEVKAMNWDAVGAMGEIIGGGAVVVSLIYLAIQIRGQNSEALAASMHAVSEGFRDSIGSLAESPEVARIWIKSNIDPDSLTDEELVQMFAIAQRNFRVWEEAFGLFQAGRLHENIWSGINAQYVAFLSHRGFNHVWMFRREFYDDQFRQYVDSLPRSVYRIRLPASETTAG